MEQRPTAELVREHEAITRMLKVMEEISDRLEAGEEVDPDDLEGIVDFIRVFADTCHHGKEEDLLFVEMEKAGVPREGGPLEVMDREHAMGRKYVAQLDDAIKHYREDRGDRDVALAIIENARSYASVLTSHISKENNILYPMANERLTGEQQQKLVEGFECVEREKVVAGKHEQYHRLLEELERKYTQK